MAMERWWPFLFEKEELIMAQPTGRYRVLSGVCPDEACRTKLYFPQYDTSVECSNCGQRHPRAALRELAEVTNQNVALETLLRSILFGGQPPRKGPESVKVLGISNYECKVLSPLLTRYGMDQGSRRARLLADMGRGDTFDCSILAERAFQIEPDQMEVSGYGRDHTGSSAYLQQTLQAIRDMSDGADCVLPIHADGDGHCLVHAISRALIGRELFWHALRANLKAHFQANRDTYRALFSDFIDSAEWADIIEECDPDFIPGDGELMGLRNIHIFGLANILHRPIILLDSISGIQSPADYTGIFLPALVPSEKCRGKDARFYKPLCVAWSSNAHNHYIALVGVKGRPMPRVPGWMMPKAWGVNHDMVSNYIDLTDDGGCYLGGSKSLSDAYVMRLVKAMEEVFKEQNGVSAALVADVNQYIFKSTGLVSVRHEVVIKQTATLLEEQRLYRCSSCRALSQHSQLPEWFQPGGRLYELVVSNYGKLDPTKHYSFPLDGLVCEYRKEEDCLVPIRRRSRLPKCDWCQETKVLLVNSDGSICYENGDRTLTPASADSRCGCGYKHYWDGIEYDNRPHLVPVKLEWAGQSVTEEVAWFHGESDPSLNSNVYEIAQRLVQKHFPGEFGSERLVQKVVNTILMLTARPEQQAAAPANTVATPSASNEVAEVEPPFDQMAASKIILSGQTTKSLHKEELTKSQTERDLQQRIKDKAPLQQRKSLHNDPPAASPTKGSAKQKKMLNKPSEKAEHSPTSPRPSVPTTGQQPDGPSSASASSVPASSAESSGSRLMTQATSSTSGTRRVRVSTSDGRQTLVSLEEDTTYSGLQALLSASLQVPPARQRIKVGFPPRELRPPGPTDEDVPLNLQHGDRITVEVLPPPAPVDEDREELESYNNLAGSLISNMPSLQNVTSPDDLQLALNMLAALTGSELWRQVQSMPKLFERGGAFYEQVKRDLKLVDNKHCTLPSLPGKTFRYNAQADILELCLEPHGHYRVEPGVEERVLGHSRQQQGSVTGGLSASFPSDPFTSDSSRIVGAALKSGSLGVAVDPKMTRSHIPFSGTGHTIGGSKSTEATTAAPAAERNIVPMETDAADTKDDPTPSSSSSHFRRIGPGYRVLEPKVQNETNTTLAKLDSVVRTIEEASEDSSDSPAASQP